MIEKLIFHFILGGLLFSSIYYFANIVEDPSLSAIIAALPVIIFSGLLIKKVEICKRHYINALLVIIITFALVLLLIQLLSIKQFSKNAMIIIILLFWFILQFCRHKYFKIKK